MVFLDYASTSPIVRFPIDTSKQWRNPNAAYAYEERKVLMDCEERIKAAIGAKDGHVLYFRCATDALEWLYEAVSNAIDPFDGWWAHSPYEHDCCLLGHECVPYDKYPMDFYCHQLVNHITGEIFDIATIRQQLDDAREMIATPYLICDCTAAIGKVDLGDVCKYADAIFMSGHKIGCMGLSFMWLNDRLFRLLGGGNDVRNQWGLKHGSLSVGHVLALADAVGDVCDSWVLDERIWDYAGLFNSLSDELVRNNIDFNIVPEFPDNDKSPFTYAINAIRLPGINADALQSYLASKGVYIGVGHSSCAEDADYRVLKAYGLTEQEASEVIRVSFGTESSIDDVKALVEGIKEYREKFC